ncbi:hypothetical protein FI667_g14984, partial [Globisporangium splendens]
MVHTTAPTGQVHKPNTTNEMIQDHELHAFGRFRLHEARGLAIGSSISMSAIQSSLQSETNPTGEWIPARLIAAAGQNAWLFEVNPAVKWFYDWEVGAARDRRAMAHVFEVCVLYERDPPPLDTKSLSSAPPIRASVPAFSVDLEVVAVVESTPFTLISFRRAPTGSTPAAACFPHEPLITASGNQSRSGPIARSSAQLIDNKNSNDNNENAARDVDDIMSGLREWDFDPDSNLHGNNNDDSDALMDPVAAATRNTVTVAWFVCHIPLTAVLPFTPAIEECLRTSLFSRLELLYPPSAAAAAPFNRNAVENVMTRLLNCTYSHPSGTDPDGNAQSFKETARETTQELIETSVSLAVWALFDADFCDQVESFLQRSARVLLDKVALHRSYQTLVEWLQERVDEHISSSGWTLERLATKINTSSNAAGFDMNWYQRDTFLSNDVEVGHEFFIAQARELYLSTQTLSPFARFAHMRIHPNAFEFGSPATAAGGLSQFAGLWLCGLDGMSVHRSQGSLPDAPQDPSLQTEPPGMINLLWFWRQLICVRLAFSSENGTPALLVTSIFNPAFTGDRLTRIVLDQQLNWFRCLPCGESTIGARIGGQIFGDYVASVSDLSTASKEIKIKCYSWPINGSNGAQRSLAASLPLATSSTAFCWHWTLSFEQGDGASVAVKLVISSGGLAGRGGGDAEEGNDPLLAENLHTEPLVRKLAYVQRWEPQCELAFRYNRLQ